MKINNTNSNSTKNNIHIYEHNFERELKSEQEPSFNFSSEITIGEVGNPQKIDMRSIDNEVSFKQNLRYWNEQVGLSSVNNFKNSYFDNIVSMGEDAVPLILEEIERKPSHLVHALDLIFPNVVEYNGFVSLEEACNTWISILK